MTLTPFIVIWSAMAVLVVALAIARNIAAMHVDDNLHLGAGEDRMIPGQIAFFGVLNRFDRWGKLLTIATVASGILMAVVYLVLVCQNSPLVSR